MTSAIRSDIAAGNRLASSLRRYPQAFDELYCNLVEVGENSGALEEMLDRLATFREKSAALRSKVRKAMYYPMAIVAVAVIVTGILLVKMVPTLAQTFAGFGAELPVFTQFVIGLSDWVIETWWICLASAALFALLAPRALRASRRLRRGPDRVMLALPIFGKIARTSCHARFARTLATTYAAGVPLVEALTFGCRARRATRFTRMPPMTLQPLCRGGQPLHKSIKDTALFPSMLVQMSSIGEESGSLDSLLERSASYFEDQVEEAVESLTSLLEPAIIVVIGTIVGGLVIAMYLPIFQLGSIIYASRHSPLTELSLASCAKHYRCLPPLSPNSHRPVGPAGREFSERRCPSASHHARARMAALRRGGRRGPAGGGDGGWSAHSSWSARGAARDGSSRSARCAGRDDRRLQRHFNLAVPGSHCP
jgi:type IV pilus assembly protein PilC